MSTITIVLLVLLIIVPGAFVYFYDDFEIWKSKAENLHKGFTDFLKNLGTKIHNFKNPWTNTSYPDEYGKTYKDEKPKTRAGADIKKMVEQIRVTRSSAHQQSTKITRRSKDGEKITASERDFIWEGIHNRQRVPCINCEIEDMYEGPQGGMSTNWRCPRCGQGINLTFYANNKDGFWCDNIGIHKHWIKIDERINVPPTAPPPRRIGDYKNQ